MLLPIGDDNRDRTITPYINYLLIAVNFVVFIFLEDYARNTNFIYTYSTLPAEILTGKDVAGPVGFPNPLTGEIEYILLGQSDIPVQATLLTSMFMHAGWAHLLGNMLYLWICGDNLENDMGHMRYFFFYLLCGVLAGLSHVFSTAFFEQNAFIPSLGASGAISGVLGGYLLMHPGRAMYVWIFFGVTAIPAIIVVGLWFVFQIVYGMGALGGQEAGGVAYAAHVGGFIAGFILVKLFVKRKRISTKERKSSW